MSITGNTNYHGTSKGCFVITAEPYGRAPLVAEPALITIPPEGATAKQSGRGSQPWL